MDELIYCSHRTVYTNQTICWDPRNREERSDDSEAKPRWREAPDTPSESMITVTGGSKRPCTLVGWSDLALFCDFWKATCFCWSGTFLGGQFQKMANFAACSHVARASHKQQSFHCQKIVGSLNIKFFENVQNSSLYIKEESPRRKFEMQSCLIFFFLSKMVKTVFDLYRWELNCFGVSLQRLRLNKLKNKFYFRFNL